MKIRLMAALTCAAICAIGLYGCGDPPTNAVEQRGSILVRGILPNDSLADSVNIKLDNEMLGVFLNPHTVVGLYAGKHLLEIGSVQVQDTTTLTYFSAPRLVEVLHNLVTTADFELVAQGPYPGNPAPDFELYDLDSNLVSLSGLAGKVVLLYFFEST